MVMCLIRANAMNGYARCPVKVRTKFECDDVRINSSSTSSDFYRGFRVSNLRILFLEKSFDAAGDVIDRSIGGDWWSLPRLVEGIRRY